MSGPRRPLAATAGALLAPLLVLGACGDDAGGPGAGGGGGASASSTSAATDAASSSTGAPSYPEPFTLQALDAARIGSHDDEPGFQHAGADLDFGEGPFESVRLVVDLASTCFPFEQWDDDPPPAGENWPASCDAFDRNFEMRLFDPADEGKPAIELVRAITPFGGPMRVEADVTDLVNGAPGPRRFDVHIATWSDAEGQVTGSDGGWTVSARFEVDPGPAPRRVLAVLPLFDGVIDEADGLAALPFEVPEGTTDGAIELRVTGHGGGAATAGCIGPAEEFCHREHLVTVDGAAFATLDPWRTDCAAGCSDARYEPWDLDYCAENPCGLPASVRAPRANWCPGSITPPFVLTGGALAVPGAHDLGLQIPGLAEGGSWRVSATYVAYGAP
jgi:hypothetical protein